jgi:sirohydrochlorin ferrochelatase
MAHLVVVGHGSPGLPDAGRSTLALADALGAAGRYDSVRPAFFRQAPFLAEVLEGLPAGSAVTVLPHLAADGGLRRTRLPALLARHGGHLGAVSVLPAAGCLPGLSCLIAARAGALGATAILLAGHGSSRGPDASRSLRALAADLPGGRALFLEEAPYLRDWRTHVGESRILVVSLLAGGGRHARHDLPAALGLAAAGEETGPFRVAQRTLWLFRPLCDPLLIASLVLAAVVLPAAD